MIGKVKVKFNQMFLLSLLVSLMCQNTYTKDFDINGVVVSISNEVTKKKVYKNTDSLYVGDITASFSNLWEEKDDKVKIKIAIKNSNPYETAKIKIKEDISPCFHLTAGNANDGGEILNIVSGATNVYNNEYKYQRNILVQDVDHIVYSNDIRLEESNNDIWFEERDNDLIMSDTNIDIRFNDTKNNVNLEGINTEVELDEYIRKNNIEIPDGVVDKFKYVSKMIQGSEAIIEIEQPNESEVVYKEKDKKNDSGSDIVKESSLSGEENSIISNDEKIDIKIDNNIKIILIIVVVFVICLAMLFIFYVFSKSYKNKDIDFDKYMGQIIVLSILSVIVCLSGKTFALEYMPKIYEYGKS
ncbi:MAG: hypothetical protein IJ593_03010, partial [Lachnospiraceae bacterium]|nr:hypothetical protein [Lachnospiraceae bacterium]